MKESVLQRRIIEQHEAQGWFVIKLIQTNKNGIPDLLCLKNGIAKFIEVKTATGKPSALQLFRLKQLQENGFEAIIKNS